MSDLPEELDRVPTREQLGDLLHRVFSGELAAYHAEKGLIAVWSGGTGFNVYDPHEWFTSESRNKFGATQTRHVPSGDTGEVYHFNMPDHSQVEDPRQYARETLEGYGFEVVGE